MSYTIRKSNIGTSPVTLTDIKNHLRIELDETDQDNYLEDLLLAATVYASKQTMRSIVQTTITLTVRSQVSRVKLPLGIIEDTLVIDLYEDSDYYVDYEAGVLYFMRPINTVGIQLYYDTGYTVQSVPADLRHAILMIVETMRQNTGDTSYAVQSFKSSFASQMLLQNNRLY